ncbi:MAG: protein kinase [Candidatus Aminicenantes bacterium]|nr:MAG: protein kinase [Candidatus Aminicenantes bacterium]
MSEHEYQRVNNYLLFKELGTDAIGVNYRAGEIDIEKRKTLKHHLFTEVYPFLYSSPKVWKRVSILLEGVKKSNIPKLYSPEQIVKEGNKYYLIYPQLKGKTLEQVLEDSTQKDTPINFDLAFSLAFAIADLIDIGSSIVVSGEKSFHGFLTPDNILIDYDGKIYLKNYGIYPYLGREEGIFKELVQKYGAWIAPEFLRKEKLVGQTDIYHLGYIIYRILTGKYYSYSPEEDFESKFSNIIFSQHIPSGDKEFLTNIITFFKKTLHPIPSQRFANIKEFKDYISNNFHIEELSSVTFSLAYFMNSLYLETMEQENKDLADELNYTLPEPRKEKEAEKPVKEEKKGDDHLVEGILSGLEDQKKSRAKLLVPLIAIIVIIIGATAFIIINQQKQAQKQAEQRIKTEEEINRRMERFKSELEAEYQKRLKAIEETAATTGEEKQAQEEEIKKLREWQKEEMRKALEKQKRLEEEQRQIEEAEQKKREAQLEKQRKLEEQKQLEEAKRKKQQEELEKKIAETEKAKMKLKEGDLVALTEVTAKPEKLKERKPVFSSFLRRKYQGNQMTLRAMLLIDETGVVAEVKMIGAVPDDLKSSIKKALKKWLYKPAVKDNIKVKVWYPVAIKVDF